MSGKIKEKSVGSKIKKLKAEGRSQKQAVAIAMQMASSFFVAPWANASVFEDVIERQNSAIFNAILEQAIKNN